MQEADWQRQITELAELLGWQWAHFRPAKTAKGWRTPVSGPLGKGFPDLVLVRASRIIFAEVKSDTGKTTPEQEAVLAAIWRTSNEAYIWRPCDWEHVVAVLQGDAVQP